MSIAGPLEQPSEKPVPEPAPNGDAPGARRRGRLTRRTVLGGAVLGAAGLATTRLLGVRLESGIPGLHLGAAPEARADWVSPLSAEGARVAHLLRRATFGATATELERARSEGYARTVDRLVETRPAPAPPVPGVTDPAQLSRLSLPNLQLWWMNHMLTSPTPFAERMTLFMHGHFTSDYRKVGLQYPYLYWQNLTWRDMAMTDLRSMLMRVTTDPAMLRYLDLAQSTGQAPNENYARELMELFSLGSGAYTEDDVRAGARALAGWTEPRPTRTVQEVVDARNNVTRPLPVWDQPATGTFVPARAHRGSLTYLGRTGTFDTQRVIDQILAQPAAATLLTSRVLSQFVSAVPDPAVVREIAAKFRTSRYDMKTLMHAVFTHPAFTADAGYRALIKSPVEFQVHTIKALGQNDLARLAVAQSPNMGMTLFDPPDVGGWPNNDSWISSNNVVARVNFVVTALGQVRTLPPAAGAAEVLDSVLSPNTARLLNQASDDATRWFLALGSPEFQLK